jgi:hypothetical protein
MAEPARSVITEELHHENGLSGSYVVVKTNPTPTLSEASAIEMSAISMSEESDLSFNSCCGFLEESGASSLSNSLNLQEAAAALATSIGLSKSTTLMVSCHKAASYEMCRNDIIRFKTQGLEYREWLCTCMKEDYQVIRHALRSWLTCCAMSCLTVPAD